MKKRKTTTKRARTARRPEVPSKRNEPAIVVVQMGTAVALEYRRDKDGKTYRHQFTTETKVHRTRDGSKLIIGPVKAGKWIE